MVAADVRRRRNAHRDGRAALMQLLQSLSRVAGSDPGRLLEQEVRLGYWPTSSSTGPGPSAPRANWRPNTPSGWWCTAWICSTSRLPLKWQPMRSSPSMTNRTPWPKPPACRWFACLPKATDSWMGWSSRNETGPGEGRKFGSSRMPQPAPLAFRRDEGRWCALVRAGKLARQSRRNRLSRLDRVKAKNASDHSTRTWMGRGNSFRHADTLKSAATRDRTTFTRTDFHPVVTV